VNWRCFPLQYHPHAEWSTGPISLSYITPTLSVHFACRQSECAEQNMYTLRYLAAAPADDEQPHGEVLGEGQRLCAGEEGEEEEEEEEAGGWGGAWVGGRVRDDDGDGGVVHEAGMLQAEEDSEEGDDDDDDDDGEESPVPSPVRAAASTKRPKPASKVVSKEASPEPAPARASTKRAKASSSQLKARGAASPERTPAAAKRPKPGSKSGVKSKRPDSVNPKKQKLRKSL
jgi:hypothetical protein